MIGNDVVDIALAQWQSNWRRPGYLEKVFTSDERVGIQQSANPELRVWVLWSMKEAAYKAYNRQTRERGFFPKKLKCTITSHHRGECAGVVQCNSRVYHTTTILHDGIIHTIALDQQHIGRTLVYATACDKDSQGLPYLSHNGCRLPASKSHHGRAEKIIALLP